MTVPRARVNGFGVPGPRGATGPAGPAGPGRTITEVSATGTVGAVDGEKVEHVTIGSSEINRTLPTAETTGQIVTIQDMSGKAGQYPIHVLPGSGDTIDGGPGEYVLDSDFGSASFARTSGGDWVNFSDGRQFEGIQVGKYLSYADGNLRNALARALDRNPAAGTRGIRMILPPGDWLMSLLTEASGGLRSNLIFDGVDRERCRIYRDTSGGMLLWNSPPSNLVFRNITFDLVNISANFSSSINAIGVTKALVEDCAFLCSIPNSVTGDGIRHQVQFSGSNIVVRRCYFRSSQLRLSNLGESTQHADCLDNIFEDCNDLGISCVGGDDDGTTDYIRNIRIGRNKFFGTLKGAGYIYVGSDAGSVNVASVSDVDIFDNECTGTIGQLGTDASRPASRLGIYVIVGNVNKRVKIRGNTVATSNPSYSTPIVTAIGVFHRDIGSSTSSEDVTIEANNTDFRSDDPRAGILVDAPGIVGLKVKRNTVAAGTRGMVIGACSNSDITENVVHATTSTALLLDSTRNAMADVRVRKNDLSAGGSFSSTIQFSGTHNMQRLVVEQNRLVTATGNAAVSGLTGGATLDFASNLNSMSAGYHASATPSNTPVGDRTE